MFKKKKKKKKKTFKYTVSNIWRCLSANKDQHENKIALRLNDQWFLFAWFFKIYYQLVNNL